MRSWATTVSGSPAKNGDDRSRKATWRPSAQPRHQGTAQQPGGGGDQRRGEDAGAHQNPNSRSLSMTWPAKSARKAADTASAHGAKAQARIRSPGLGTQALHALGRQRCLGQGLRPSDPGSRQRLPDDRQHHRPGAPAGCDRKRGGQNSALGRSRGGLSTKIHLAVDGEGRPVRFILTAGQVNDGTQALALLGEARPRYFLADKGYDSHAILDAVEACGAQPIIPRRSCMKRIRDFDARIYKKRNLVERAINKLKHFRRIATHYDRKVANFMAFLCLATLPLWCA